MPNPSNPGANMPVSIVEWRPVRKNTLRGFVTLRVGKAMVIHECAVQRKGAQHWVSLPAKQRLGRDGMPIVGPNGKAVWVPLISWQNRDAADRFSRSVIDALTTAHPDALDDVDDDQ